jgi:uncharacterized membrane protein
MAGTKQAKSASQNGNAKAGSSTKTSSTKTNGAKPNGTKSSTTRTNGPRPNQNQRNQNQTRRARDRARAKELAEQQATAEPEETGPPAWVRYTSLVLAILGLGVSVYMTYEHFTNNSTLACKVNSVVNCGAVTTSPEAMVFGVFPVAVLGLAFYAFMVAATTPWAWRSQRREIGLLRLGSVIVGIGFVIYLLYVELFQVGFICLECTSVHIITFLLFVVVVMSAAVWGLPGTAERAKAKYR